MNRDNFEHLSALTFSSPFTKCSSHETKTDLGAGDEDMHSQNDENGYLIKLKK